ncbi:MAG TPA: hypothetical protein VGB94_04075 [Acidobacteriaceae bacterium]
MLHSYKMSFQGELLKRGFWLYVWDIKGDKRHLYVGRTGDYSSPNASSPFRRIGQHLDARINAKGNTLAKRLREARVDCETCTFEMIAIGPIYPEQTTMATHLQFRDKTSALERALADELRERGYEVLGKHDTKRPTDTSLLSQVLDLISESFPSLN